MRGGGGEREEEMEEREKRSRRRINMIESVQLVQFINCAVLYLHTQSTSKCKSNCIKKKKYSL